LRARLAARIAAFTPRRIPPAGQRRAAVALVVCRDEGAAALVVTRRSPSLRAHSRQWALPGGRVDAGETAVETALRELREEVALVLDDEHVLGQLDDYATRSGYVITPVVTWSDCDWRELDPNPDEVELIRPFTFAELAREDSPILEPGEAPQHQVLSMHFFDDRIFAPTGAMLYQFREVALFGRHTPVAHFDQPRFAWR
jgi:8-oxo-dGTP pyrophosphatase MutT (NUDIX family)